MQLGNVSTDPAKDFGVTYARELYNLGLPRIPTFSQDGTLQYLPHPDASPTDSHYLMKRIGTMVDSWAAEAVRAGATQPTPLPPGTVNGVPQEVTKRQGVQALINAGLIGMVQPAIDGIADATTRATMQNEWTNSQTFQRQRPALISLAVNGLGLTMAQLDDLFIAADKL